MIRYIKYILAGMMLFTAGLTFAQVNQWQDLYKVKKKDTMYGIAQKYGITLDELKDANPEMKKEDYGLKKGETIFIPFAKPQLKVSRTQDPSMTAKTDVRNREIRVGIMLPLHDVDGDGRRMVEYYRGILLAVEDMKAQGISAEIHAWNVPIDADIRETLLGPIAKTLDIIFGPLYTPQVKALATFCAQNDIKLVIPFSIASDEVTRIPHIFQIYQDGSKLNNDAIKVFLERFKNNHPIFIDCNDKTSTKGSFTFGLRNQLEQKGIKYSITSLGSSEEMFAKAFSRTQPNVVVLNSGRSPELKIAFQKLNGFRVNNPQVEISMFGYTEWLMYVRHDLGNFYAFDTYIPTTFYYNPVSWKTQQLERKYYQWFGVEMQQSLPRFALTGYDQAQFFLQGLHKYGRDFTGEKGKSLSTPVQTPYYFVRQGSGGMQNENFQLIHYKKDKTIESLTY
ncbi:MAG: LysM peptidoglycan-binding domain-containing protein [Prevotella sp.]